MAINSFNLGFLFFRSSADVPDNKDTFFNAEGEIGLSFPQELLNASAIMITFGYRAEAWFDVNNTSNSFAIAVGANAPPNNLLPFGSITGDREADLFFHGPFVRMGLNF